MSLVAVSNCNLLLIIEFLFYLHLKDFPRKTGRCSGSGRETGVESTLKLVPRRAECMCAGSEEQEDKVGVLGGLWRISR